MKTLILACIASLVFGCVSVYDQNVLLRPPSKLVRGRSVVIATPANGSYEAIEYPFSGRNTALEVRSAFVRYSNNVEITSECKDLICLKKMTGFEYYVIPEILHWEERATEWSGMPDKIEIKLTIYEGQNWNELASAILSGRSKWVTFGGDHPQDLLPEPLNEYVGSLY
jgi:hypothetical protein